MNLRISLAKLVGGAAAVLLAIGMVTSVAYATISTITNVAPNAGSNERGDVTITWDATTDDPSNDKVDIYYSTNDFAVETKLTTSDILASTGAFTWDTVTAGIPDSTNYKVKVQSTSNSTSGISATVFTIDNTAPTFVVNNGTDAGPVQTDTINVTTVDATSGVAAQEYGFSTDNVCDASDTYGNAFTSGTDFSISGDHTDFLCVTATDNAGNVAYELVGQLNTDNTAPSITAYTLDGIAGNAFFSPAVSGTVAINITANEIVNWATVRVIDVAGVEYKTLSPGSTGTDVNVSWDGTLTSPVVGAPASDGPFQLLYTITDLAGNTSGSLVGPLTPYQIIVDNTAPTMTSVVAKTVQGAGDTITVVFDEDVVAADGDWTDGNELGFTMDPGGASIAVTTTNANFSFDTPTNTLTVTLDESTDNSWLKNGLLLRAYTTGNKIEDLAGNELSGSKDDTSIDGDSVVPTVALTYDIDRQVKDADTIVITATFSEKMDSTPQIAIATAGDGSLAATNMTMGADRTEWTYSWDVPTGSDDDGTATITITGEDLAGNTMVNAANTRIIDNTDPVLGSFTNPLADTVYRTDAILTFSATDNSSTEVCSYSLDAGATYTTLASCSETNATVAGLAEGRNVIELKIEDEAGNIILSGNPSFVYDTDGILTVGTVPAQDFDTIQDAIDAWVTDITTISVSDGTYTETVVVDQALTVESVNGSGSTSIVGSINVDNDNVNINGFSISNPSGSFGVIVSGTSNVVVENNNINNIGTALASGSAQGIYLNGGNTNPSNIDFSNNTISNIGNTSMLHGGGSGSSAKGIYVGTTSGTGTITGLSITNNTISNIYASIAPWIGGPGYGGGAGAIGIMINFGGATTADISNNTITTLEGLWARGVGLEGDTPNTSVTDNTISGLIDHKAGTDAIAVFAEDNAHLSTITVNNNKFNVSAINGVVIDPTTTIGVLDATNNWWGHLTGPHNTNANDAGQGVEVWPSSADGYANYVDFSPFYNSAAMTDLVSVDPIASFDLDISPSTQVVNQNSAVTVTAKDMNGIVVVNDTTTKVDLDGDNGASFPAGALLTMEADGDVTTTVTNSTSGTVNVDAFEVGGLSTGSATVTFSGTDTIAPIVNSFTVSSIAQTSATLNVTTDENATCKYSANDEAYSTMTAMTTTGSTTHSVDLTGLTEDTPYTYFVRCEDASINTNTMTVSSAASFTTLADTPDTTKPVITVLGDASVTLTVGDSYSDAGATATDNIDGNITASIVTVSNVNTAIAGAYTVTYDVQDAAGNDAIQKTRVVVVNEADATPPVISSVSTDKAEYEVSDTSVVVTVIEDDTASTVTVNGDATGIVESPAGTWTYTLTHPGVVGTYSVVVVTMNTVGDASSREISYGVVADPVVDNTAPVITLVGSDMTLTVGDTYNEPGATATDDTDGNITGDIVITGTVDTATAGVYTVKYNVRDAAGNDATEVTRTVTVNATDTTVPTVASTNPTTGSTGVAITVRPSVTFDDVLDATTVSSSAVTLVKNSDSSTIPAIVALVEGGKTIEITPSADLENGTEYHVEITNAVKNNAGLAYAGSTNVTTFTTETIAPLVVDPKSEKSRADANDKYIDGWQYTYYVTINNDETKMRVRFADWLNSDGDPTHKVEADGNMRILFNTADGSGTGTVTGLTEADLLNGYGTVVSFEVGNAYPDWTEVTKIMDTTGMDIDLTTPGRQVKFDVFTKLPLSTVAGLYTTTYDVETQ